MKKFIVALFGALILSGCGNNEPRSFEGYHSNPSREAYCRSIGLYKEWDSNECETWADAYDLDESQSKKYKKKYKSKYDKKYTHVIVVSDPAKLKAHKAKEAKRMAIYKKQQSEIAKLKKERAVADAKIRRQKEELKRQQAANKKKKDAAKKKSSSISFKKSSSSSKKSSSSKRK